MCRLLVLFAGMLAFTSGCRADEEEKRTEDVETADTGSVTSEGVSTTPCDIGVAGVSVAEGETDVYYRSVIRVDLTEEDPEAEITIFGGDGLIEVAGETTVDGVTLSWRGDPLQPFAEYVAWVSHACGVHTTSFTTSDIGLPLAADVAGRVYAFNLFGAEFIEPGNVGTMLRAVLGESTMLLQPLVEPVGDVLMLRVGLADDAKQETCMPTMDLRAYWDDPYFASTEMDVEVRAGVHRFTINAFTFTGAFAADGSQIAGGTVSGWFDIRPLNTQLFGEDADPYEFCETLEDFGAPCSECADGEVLCLSLLAENATAVLYEKSFEQILVEELPPRCD